MIEEDAEKAGFISIEIAVDGQSHRVFAVVVFKSP